MNTDEPSPPNQAINQHSQQFINYKEYSYIFSFARNARKQLNPRDTWEENAAFHNVPSCPHLSQP